MKRYAIVGAGHRCFMMFARNIDARKELNAELCGVYDINRGRSEYFKRKLTNSKKLKIYEDFDEMIRIEKPDAVIVTTPDCFHDQYIVETLKQGFDVITEKPMATDFEKIQRIISAEREYGKKVTVTFNCRFMPVFEKLKSLLKANAIGKIFNVNYEYLLGRPHGADYFRRWHRYKRNSNSLLVHKSTHHFDIVNWLLEDEPVTVSAKGDLLFFGKAGKFRGKRCLGCEHASYCEFYEDMRKNEFYKELYLDNEKIDGYLRDSCVFTQDADIYDTMSVLVQYKRGTILTYNLSMYNQYEGYKITLTGENGRLELTEYMDGCNSHDPLYRIQHYCNDMSCITYSFEKAGGEHSGGDARLLDMVIGGNTKDPLGQCSDSLDGARSALIGICAVESIREKHEINMQQYMDKLKK